MSESTYAADTFGSPAPALSVSPVMLPAPGRAATAPQAPGQHHNPTI